MIYLFPPFSAHLSSSWHHWRSTHCFQIELDWTPGYSEEIESPIYWCCQQVKWVTRLCKSKFCRKQQSKQLCHRKWAKPENDPTVVSSTSRCSLQIEEKNPSATLWSVSFVSIWWVKPPHQHQPHPFTAVWYLLNPRAVFPVRNLEGFVICQACLNVHALKIFKGFCHTHKALAELPFLQPLLGCSGRGLTS